LRTKALAFFKANNDKVYTWNNIPYWC
jgi:hypothetical protein